ncbi:hypothetical protein [Campylobacter taeniopygiae]|uniref:hypothetical protein n=1 Tax=Campylobacter taeniopygiae TaxID=2510188 RepID=UPI003D6B77E7
MDEDLQKEYVKIYHTSMSVKEFKQKWLDLQAKHEARFGEIAEQSRKDIQQEMQTAQEQEIKTFKPIQAESKNKETYKDDNIRNELIKKLLENKFDLAKELEILFNVKIDNDNTNNNSNINNNNSNTNDNNSNSNHLSKLSSKTKTKHRSVNIKV